MKNTITVVTGMLLSIQFAQALTTDPIYSYGSEEIIHQLDELPIVRKIGGGTKFLITYENEEYWTMDMKGAFDYACKIWEEQLPSLPPIKVSARISDIHAAIENPPLTSVQSNIVDLAYPRENITSYLSTRLKYTVFTELLRGTPFLGQNLVKDSLFSQRDDIIITINKSQLNDISFSIDTDCEDKYDAITLFLRDIARGLGISTGYYTNPRFPCTLFKPNRLPTPFESLIEDKIFFDDPNEAYDDATQGSIPMEITWYPQLSLYAPYPWQQGVSLNTFIPMQDSQLSKLLSCNFGKGSVLRNIFDPNLDTFLEYGLKWNYILWTGTGSPSLGTSSGSTNEIIALDGIIKNNTKNNSYFLLYSSDNDTLGLITPKQKKANQSGYYIGYDYEKYNYIYDPDTESSTYKPGVTVGILKVDGSWDIVFKDFLNISSDIYVKDFQFHEPTENYARTCDGYLRMRVVRQSPSSKSIACTFYALDYYPQKIEMGDPIVFESGKTRSNTPMRLKDEDDYSRNIIIPIRNIEGIDRIEVSQLDEGNSYPYYYDIDDFKKGFFTTIVDCEFYSWITLTSYNHNGHTKSETLFVSLSDGEYALSDFKAEILSDYHTLTFSIPNQRKVFMIDYYIIPLTVNNSNIALQGSVSSDTPYVNIESLPKGYYGISYTINGVTYSSKFAKI